MSKVDFPEGVVLTASMELKNRSSSSTNKISKTMREHEEARKAGVPSIDGGITVSKHGSIIAYQPKTSRKKNDGLDSLLTESKCPTNTM